MSASARRGCLLSWWWSNSLGVRRTYCFLLAGHVGGGGAGGGNCGAHCSALGRTAAEHLVSWKVPPPGGARLAPGHPCGPHQAQNAHNSKPHNLTRHYQG
jgi:hypothetical protein